MKSLSYARNFHLGDYMRILATIVAILSLCTGCSWEAATRPNVLVLAIDGLNADTPLCSDVDSEWSLGFGPICDEGVRFSHTYTTSTMSQAAMASILTGAYPHENGVWHNGNQFLSEKFETASELAVEKGYRTLFVSGGAPIFRKSGLSQGFEVFEDNIPVQAAEFFRPAIKSFDIFLNWLTSLKRGESFFSVLYLADLQFPDRLTVNELGQERALGVESQLKEINESVAVLGEALIRLKRWDSTYIVVVGLNGLATSSQRRELRMVNLTSDLTQVFMVIKPPKKNREGDGGWSIDVNVNLADLGATLFEIFGEKQPRASNEFVITSLLSALEKPRVTWERSRLLVMSTAWADWRGVGGPRIAFRKNNFLAIDGKKLLIFNTLADRFEQQPMSSSDISVQPFLADIRELMGKLQWSTYEGLSDSLAEKLELAQSLRFVAPISEENKIRLAHLVDQRLWDRQTLGWMARVALAEQNWPLLEKLGNKYLYPEWVYTAQMNLKTKAVPPVSPCWQWMTQPSLDLANLNKCEDTEIKLMVQWLKEKDSRKRAINEEKFYIHFQRREIDEAISWANFRSHVTWDTNLEVPAEPRASHLVFAMPEYRWARQAIERRVRK